MALSPRTRRAAAAAVLAVALSGGLAACSTQPESIRSYTPANGANADVPGIKARALTLVDAGGRALLHGSFLAADGDALTGIDALAIAADGKPGAPLTVTSSRVVLPAGTLVPLGGHPVLVEGSGLVPGLTAQLALHFDKAGTVQVVVPVVSSDHPDWATATPKPGDVAKQASPTPAATPSASARPSTTTAPGEVTPSVSTTSASPTATS